MKLTTQSWKQNTHRFSSPLYTLIMLATRIVQCFIIKMKCSYIYYFFLCKHLKQLGTSIGWNKAIIERHLRFELLYFEGNICIGQCHSILMQEGNEHCLSTIHHYTLGRSTSCSFVNAPHQDISTMLIHYFVVKLSMRHRWVNV